MDVFNKDTDKEWKIRRTKFRHPFPYSTLRGFSNDMKELIETLCEYIYIHIKYVQKIQVFALLLKRVLTKGTSPPRFSRRGQVPPSVLLLAKGTEGAAGTRGGGGGDERRAMSRAIISYSMNQTAMTAKELPFTSMPTSKPSEGKAGAGTRGGGGGGLRLQLRLKSTFFESLHSLLYSLR